MSGSEDLEVKLENDNEKSIMTIKNIELSELPL